MWSEGFSPRCRAGSSGPAKTPLIDVLASVTTAALALAALLTCQSPASAARDRPPPGGGLPVSLERIRTTLERPQALDVDVPLSLPVVRFEITVEARPYMLQFVQTAPPAFYARDIERFRRYLSGSR